MENDSTTGRGPATLSLWAIWGAGAAALAYLVIVHRPHLLGWLPYLVIFACPLMHLFMHRGHHHGGQRSRETPLSDRVNVDTTR